MRRAAEWLTYLSWEELNPDCRHCRFIELPGNHNNWRIGLPRHPFHYRFQAHERARHGDADGNVRGSFLHSKVQIKYQRRWRCRAKRLSFRTTPSRARGVLKTSVFFRDAKVVEAMENK